MTSKQIKRAAASQLRQNFEGISMAVLNQFALITFMLMIEALIYITSELSDIDYRPLQISYYRESRVRIFTMCGRMLGYLFLNSVLVYIQRRRFINTGEDGGVVERYIAMHPKRIMLPGVKLSIQLLFYKILVLSPMLIGIYGVLHFSSKEVVSSISLFGMVCFMLSIGFSIVWLGVCIHYFMSLSLVPFISQLNPRANFFDACDLSVKLMESKHMRLVSFYISWLPWLPLAVLIYPLIFIYPYYSAAQVILAREIMGDYWQDKLPAMARRWQKNLY